MCVHATMLACTLGSTAALILHGFTLHPAPVYYRESREAKSVGMLGVESKRFGYLAS